MQNGRDALHMMKFMAESSEEQLLHTIYQAIFEKKGLEAVDLDLSNLQINICNHFVICHGMTSTQTRAIAEHIENKLIDQQELNPYHKEGFENALWILLDYGGVIVHVFEESQRRFYDLEGLWADGKREEIKDQTKN